jgi:O-antigen/teichoic acid export membrane protein
VLSGRGGRVARNSLLSMIALIVLGGTRVVYGAIISRATDLQTFGEVGAMIAVAMLASYVLPAGIGAATSRFIPFERGAGDIQQARASYVVLSTVGMLAAGVLGLLAAAAVALLGRPLLEAVEVGLLAIAYSLYTTDKAALYAFERVDRYVRIEIATSGLAIVLTLAVAWSGATVFLLPFIVSYGVFSLLARQAVRSSASGPRLDPWRRPRRDLLGYSFLAGIGILAGAGSLQGTQLLAVWFAAPTEVAHFAAAVTLTAPLYFMPRALALALFPFMSESYGAGDLAAVRRHADLATRGLLACGALVLVAAEILAPVTLAVFGGAEYVAGASVLRLILLAAFLTIIAVPAINSLSSGPGWQLKTPVGWSVAGCVVGLALVAAIGGPLGALGVAISYLVGTAITSAGPLLTAWHRLTMSWLGPLARGLGVVVAGLLVGTFVDHGATDVAGLASVVAVATVGTLLSAVVLIPDLRALSRGLGGRRPADPTFQESLVARPSHGKSG